MKFLFAKIIKLKQKISTIIIQTCCSHVENLACFVSGRLVIRYNSYKYIFLLQCKNCLDYGITSQKINTDIQSFCCWRNVCYEFTAGILWFISKISFTNYVTMKELISCHAYLSWVTGQLGNLHGTLVFMCDLQIAACSLKKSASDIGLSMWILPWLCLWEPLHFLYKYQGISVAAANIVMTMTLFPTVFIQFENSICKSIFIF